MDIQSGLRKYGVAIILVTLLACTLLEPEGSPVAPEEAPAEAALQGSPEATEPVVAGTTRETAQLVDSMARVDPDTPTAAPPTPSPTLQTATATPTTQPEDTPAAERYVVEARSQSEHNALRHVELVLHTVQVTDQSMILRVAFANVSEKAFTLTASANGSDAVLIDAAGNRYQPVDVDDNLQQGIAPAGGFEPGSANVGNLTFPRPASEPPYKLQFPTFQPISFELDSPAPAPTFTLISGRYQINERLHSYREGLSNIDLQLESLQIQTDTVVFDLSFVNTLRQGYDLLGGPTGSDARLLDAEGTQSEPLEVSPSLESSIAPDGGWLPDEQHPGTMTFPKPAAPERLRFIFPGYNALTLRFDQTGALQAEITSSTGDTPRPTPTPLPEQRLVETLDSLLASQSEALQAGEKATYLESFVPALQSEQEQIFDRLARVPLTSYTLHLAPNVTFEQADLEADTLEEVAVQVRYTLEGINPENRFLHNLDYTFTRSQGSWRIGAITLNKNPPFWRTGDVTVRETEHFLIFARPELQDDFSDLVDKTDRAYESLGARGLTLEPRYVAYFTADQPDFAALTGYSAGRIVGMALSRYTFTGDEILVSGYAFYINGEVLKEEANSSSQPEFQTTITHELVHLVLAPVTRPFTPVWLVEGAAVYFSEETDSQERQRLLADNHLEEITLEALTRAERLGEHDYLGEQTGFEYSFAKETFTYLVDTYGQEKTLAFYRSYADAPQADLRQEMPRFGNAFTSDAAFTGLREQLTAEAVHEFFGVTLTELDRDVKNWLRKEVE